jgi:hypothetical protein
VKIWRHIHGIFAAVGATNVTWVWCPNINISGSEYGPMGPLYPGHEYVDWTCLDGYKLGWRRLEQPQLAVHWLLQQHHRHDRPKQAYAHRGDCSTESGGSKSEWITSMFTSLASSYPKVHGLLWFNKINEGLGD